MPEENPSPPPSALSHHNYIDTLINNLSGNKLLYDGVDDSKSNIFIVLWSAALFNLFA